MTEERGKRQMARKVAWAWLGFSVLCFSAIALGGLESHESDSIVAIHWAVTMVSGPLIFGLFGLDVAQLKLPEKT
jgi:hypothetical protein